ncbi:hypothetical protein C8J56DRAFT_893758 [Mycena floridula]|nr:hypothetical protein C8J56DRAFT_893758 [Mycena floridula]
MPTSIQQCIRIISYLLPQIHSAEEILDDEAATVYRIVYSCLSVIVEDHIEGFMEDPKLPLQVTHPTLKSLLKYLWSAMKGFNIISADSEGEPRDTDSLQLFSVPLQVFGTGRHSSHLALLKDGLHAYIHRLNLNEELGSISYNCYPPDAYFSACYQLEEMKIMLGLDKDYPQDDPYLYDIDPSTITLSEYVAHGSEPRLFRRISPDYFEVAYDYTGQRDLVSLPI